MLRNKRGRDSERPAHRDEDWPPLAATRESPRTETKTQHSHKINKLINKKKKKEIPYVSAIPLLDMFPKELTTATQTNTCTQMFIAALLTVVKIWK